MAVIFLFSTDLFSVLQTHSIAELFLQFIFPRMPQEWIVNIHMGIRKCAHMVAYAILSWFYVMGLVHSFVIHRKWSWKIAGVAIALCILYACSDEWHQSFSIVRTATVRDVGWNTLGACFAQLISARGKA